jgi:hypothetical protein
LILIDRLRADPLGCLGYRRKTRPRIDAFRRAATRFEQALARAVFDASVPRFIVAALDAKFTSVDAAFGKLMEILERECLHQVDEHGVVDWHAHSL